MNGGGQESKDPADVDGDIPGAGRKTSRILITLLVAVLAIALTASVTQWVRANRLDTDADERLAAELAASAMATALQNYSYQDLAAQTEAVLALATDRFKSTYTDSLELGLRDLLVRLETSSIATVRHVFLMTPTGGTTRAIVVSDSEVQSTAGTRTVTGAYLEMELLNLDGEWLIDAVTSLVAEEEDIVPAPTDG